MKHSTYSVRSAGRTFFTGLAALWILATAGACQPAAAPSARHTAQPMPVQMTPALTIFSDQYRSCADEMPGIGLVVLEKPASALELSSIGLRWGAGKLLDGYAAVIGQEELVVVVHPQNPLSRISLADLQDIYLGRLRDWQGPAGEIQAWAYPTGDDVRAVFESAVLSGIPAAESAVSLAPNPAALREAVAANPAAIGFLPSRWVDSSVKALAVDNLSPALIKQPLLAVSKSEPIDPEKSWLICLQEQLQ